MTAPFKLGQHVSQVVRPVTGEVVKVEYDDKHDQFRVLVRSEDLSERWFWQTEIEDATQEAA